MTDRIVLTGLKVDARLVDFVDNHALPGTGIDSAAFWNGFASAVADLMPKNRALLARRKDLQAQIDAWHIERRGQPHDAAAYRAFLTEIGYLVPEGPDFSITTSGTDPEIAHVPGPQLVVPVMNARYALNAANARWGSLYDALYGTDALGDLPAAPGYDTARGARVMAWGRAFLDDAVPLAAGSWTDATGFSISMGQVWVTTPAGATGLADPARFAGFVGDTAAPSLIVLKNNGLHIGLVVDAAP